MTKKDDFQKELLEKVKPGTKPSDFRKLKKSKSADDIPKAPPLPPNELKKQTDLNVLLQDQLKEKQQEIELLRQQKEDSAKQIEALRQKDEDSAQQIESLRKQLEETHPTPTELSQLDQSLIARHQSIKDWFTQYSKNKELDTELQENIDQASAELISQDKKISNLQNQIAKLQQTNQSLQKDLELAQKLANLRKNPLPDNNSHSSNLLVYAFLALWFISLLNSSWKPNFKDN